MMSQLKYPRCHSCWFDDAKAERLVMSVTVETSVTLRLKDLCHRSLNMCDIAIGRRHSYKTCKVTV
jgi:hypothetical protein